VGVSGSRIQFVLDRGELRDLIYIFINFIISREKKMRSGKSYSIVLIGAGNVATHLADALHNAGHNILTVFSRGLETARLLAAKIDAASVSKLSDLPEEADFYIVSVRDNVLEEVVSNLKVTKGMVVHTSGSTGMDVFQGRLTEYGVFYPFQTFRKEQSMDMANVPLLIESNNTEGLNSIRELAKSISSDVRDISSEMRANLHLTAAFACNFSNYMVAIAEEILKEHQMDKSLLLPLIEETFRKIMLTPAVQNQTGPAIRGDTITMEKHLDLLKKHPEWQKLYILVSQLIQSNG
jgi:predicted short-subunit dehydrogenase-like oxidoreductase (DUF2520 family)